MSGQKIILKSSVDGFEFGAWRFAPSGDRKGGLLLIQEIFGVNETIRATAADFAARGYEVIAPSLFDRTERDFLAGYDQDGFTRGRAAAGAIDWTVTTADMQAGLNALGDGPRFVAGFCWGGGAAWIAACRCEGLNAVSSFYGRLVTEFLGETNRCPVVFHYGAKDAHIPAEMVERVRAAEKPDTRVFVYDAGHGFFSDRRDDYEAKSADKARARTLALFEDPSRLPD